MAHGRPGTQEVLDRRSLSCPPPTPTLGLLSAPSSPQRAEGAEAAPRTCQGLAGSPISALSKKPAVIIFL